MNELRLQKGHEGGTPFFFTPMSEELATWRNERISLRQIFELLRICGIVV